MTDESGLSAALETGPELEALRTAELAELALFSDCEPEQLQALAERLRPVRAEDGQVLMRQGEQAVSFILIQNGAAEVSHVGDDGEVVLDWVGAGVIVGEIALLRDRPRTATVTATETLSGFIGDEKAFGIMADLPGVSSRLLRTVRQRLAAFITPVEVTFKDGSELMLRPVLPGDGERSEHASVEYSTDTLYRRFMSTRAPSPALMNYLFQVDYVGHFVWVLVDGPDGPVVADVRFVRDVEDPAVAEIAFIVADDYQGRGIGTFLMDALIVAARVGGVQRFTARLLAENHAMRAILDRYGAEWERDEPGVVTTEFDVPDTLRISPELAEGIRSMARQVLRASVN
ncbi:MAG: GNAT family N-acetyltransferase [Mycobacterium sp.]